MCVCWCLCVCFYACVWIREVHVWLPYTHGRCIEPPTNDTHDIVFAFGYMLVYTWQIQSLKGPVTNSIDRVRTNDKYKAKSAFTEPLTKDTQMQTFYIVFAFCYIWVYTWQIQ